MANIAMATVKTGQLNYSEGGTPDFHVAEERRIREAGPRVVYGKLTYVATRDMYYDVVRVFYPDPTAPVQAVVDPIAQELFGGAVPFAAQPKIQPPPPWLRGNQGRSAG